MSKRKQIDRNNYRPMDVLRIVETECDPTRLGPVMARHELLRLLEESARAYMILRAEARDLFYAIEEAAEMSQSIAKLLYPRNKDGE
jgi:hypothetical protein